MQNILLDADAMYPEGFHPVEMDMVADFSHSAKHISRTDVGAKAKYYYAHFDISVYIQEHVDQKLVTGFLGRDQDPPELHESTSYDPFKLDIFIIGNMFEKELRKVITPLSVVSSRNSQISRNTPTLSSYAPSSLG